MPMPKSSSKPAFFQPTASSATRSRMAAAMRTARSAGSGTGTGSLKKIIMPSPVKRSSVPSHSRMSLPISAWYWRSTAMTSSGSDVSAKAVKPRRSRKTTVMSRRWLLRGSSAPPVTMASASWGEKKRLSRPRRSSWATWDCTRSSRVRLSSASSSQSCLTLRSERTRASSSGWLMGLVRKSSAPASIPLTRSCDGSRAVTMTTGRSAVAGSARRALHTS